MDVLSWIWLSLSLFFVIIWATAAATGLKQLDASDFWNLDVCVHSSVFIRNGAQVWKVVLKEFANLNI